MEKIELYGFTIRDYLIIDQTDVKGSPSIKMELELLYPAKEIMERFGVLYSPCEHFFVVLDVIDANKVIVHGTELDAGKIFGQWHVLMGNSGKGKYVPFTPPKTVINEDYELLVDFMRFCGGEDEEMIHKYLGSPQWLKFRGFVTEARKEDAT